MPLYYYRAKATFNKVVEGRIEAESKESALKKIEDKGLYPVQLQEISTYSQERRLVPLRGIKRKKITVFTRQLAILIKSGVPILKALDILTNQIEDKIFKLIIEEMRNDIQEGATLSSALNRYPNIFSSFYRFMVKAGEDSGKLNEVLARIADYREREEEIISRVKIALVYPAFMLLVGIGTVIFMLTFVMPRLMDIFNDIGKETLPISTRILIGFSYFFKEKGVMLLGAILLLFFIFLRERKKTYWINFLSIIQLRLPIFKKLIISKEIARLARTLGILIKSGIPILKALDLTIPTLDNEVIKKALQSNTKYLEEGKSLEFTLRRTKLFPEFVISLIAVGEEAGHLDVSLEELAEIYENDLEKQMKVFTTLLEPLIVLIMGLIVGFVVMAMLLPIFQINLMVR